MARTYSNVKEPHRNLKVDPTDPQKGEDVRALRVSCAERLGARGLAPFAPDTSPPGEHTNAEYGTRTRDACAEALYWLGAMESTVAEARNGRLSVGAQRMIRFPGRRGEEQLGRTRSRAKELERKVEKLHRDAKPAKTERQRVIDAATAAARLGLRHAPEVHYTQGLRRWDGIRLGLIASRGEFPRYADCSSFYTWCLWQQLRDGPDELNGQQWSAGFTGTLALHGRRDDDAPEGAAVLYGSGWPYAHVVYSLGGGEGISHGSEIAPFLVPLNYRGDRAQARVFV